MINDYDFASQENVTKPVSHPRNRRRRENTNQSESKVLIVEDELLVAENLKETLQSNGFTGIEVLSSAEEAIEKFALIDPDLIIMDVRLSGTLDGIQAAILIHKTLKKVPILFLTAYPKEDFPHLATIDPAFYSYLSKPYDTKELSGVMEGLLGR